MVPINSVEKMKKAICDKLKLNFGCAVDEATEGQMMRASALVLREIMADREIATKRATRESICVRCITFRWSSSWGAA